MGKQTTNEEEEEETFYTLSICQIFYMYFIKFKLLLLIYIIFISINLLDSYVYGLNMSVAKFIHKNCINNLYPFSEVIRFRLNFDEILWCYDLPNYNPPEYNSDVLLNKSWADPPLGNF